MSQVTTRSIPILMYHSISEQAVPSFRPFAVPPALFDQQMRYLHEQGYVSLTLSQLITHLSQQTCTLPDRVVVLTFDDGFADFLSEALPVLKRYGLVATLYIPTSYVGSTSKWMWRDGEGERPILNWEQIAEVRDQGIEIGAHTLTHPQLDLIPLARARQEIVQSKDILEQRLQQPVLSFAYPYGYHRHAIKRLVREAGFTSACAVKYEMSHTADDHFALARLLASNEIGVTELAAILANIPPSTPRALYREAMVPAWRLLRFYSGKH
jgi:peptidoglycan/xylan/chitin deacetylase (PgdA/CDA1 family)